MYRTRWRESVMGCIDVSFVRLVSWIYDPEQRAAGGRKGGNERGLYTQYTTRWLY